MFGKWKREHESITPARKAVASYWKCPEGGGRRGGVKWFHARGAVRANRVNRKREREFILFSMIHGDRPRQAFAAEPCRNVKR